MNALVEFSFERWEKCQFADLVVEYIDDYGFVRSQNPVVNAKWSETFGMDNGLTRILDIQVSVDGEINDLTILYFTATDSWQYVDNDNDQQFHLYIKTR